MPRVTTPEHQQAARAVRELLAHYEENRDLIQVGAYRKGADPLLDRAVARAKAIDELLHHGAAPRPMRETLRRMLEITTGG